MYIEEMYVDFPSHMVLMQVLCLEPEEQHPWGQVHPIHPVKLEGYLGYATVPWDWPL